MCKNKRTESRFRGIICIFLCFEQYKMLIIPLNLDSVLLLLHNSKLTVLTYCWYSSRQDRTKTGHALGEPGSRPTNAEPQRNLSPILCSLLRILMHASMVMGTCKNAQVMFNDRCAVFFLQMKWKIYYLCNFVILVVTYLVLSRGFESAARIHPCIRVHYTKR